ncbi:MAG TPA: hypothetical protein VGJ92_06845, partial [Methanocella sp.]
KIDGKIVAAQQNNLLALAFHPELTDDLRLHKYFLEMIPGGKKPRQSPVAHIPVARARDR